MDHRTLPVALIDGANAYVYGPDGLPVEQTSASATLFFHHDHIGSTRELTDGNGVIQGSYQFDSYGNQLSHMGSGASPLLYEGQYQDAESGLYFLRSRYYDPTSGRFLSRDPLVAQTRSPYAYVYDNPLNSTDPSGECGLWGNDTCWGDAAGAVANVASTAWNGATSAVGNAASWTWDHTGGAAVNWVQNHTVGLCISGSIFGGIGVNGSWCPIVASHGQIGMSGTFGVGLGLGGGVSGGIEVSNATCLDQLGGPFGEVGGGFGPIAVGGQLSPDRKTWVVSGGLSASTPEGYVSGTQTDIWRWR